MEPVNVFIDAVNKLVEPVYAFNDAVVANEPESTTEPTVKLNVVPLPFVNVTTLLLTEAVTNAFDADVADDAVNEFIDAVNVFIDAVNAIIEALKALIEELNVFILAVNGLYELVSVYDEGNKLPNLSESKDNDAVATEPD